MSRWEGIAREVKKKPARTCGRAKLVRAYGFAHNKVIMPPCRGNRRCEAVPELVDYRLYDLDETQMLAHCQKAQGLADWLRARHEPVFLPKKKR